MATQCFLSSCNRRHLEYRIRTQIVSWAVNRLTTAPVIGRTIAWKSSVWLLHEGYETMSLLFPVATLDQPQHIELEVDWSTLPARW